MMSVKYMNGFDYIPAGATAAQFASLLYADGWYGFIQGDFGDSLGTVAGRFGLGTALRVIDPPGGARLRHATMHRFASSIMGIAVWLPPVITDGAILYIDSLTNNIPFKMTFDTTGAILFTLQNSLGSRVYRSRTGAYRARSWFYIQIKHVGTDFEVLLNGDIVVQTESALNSSDMEWDTLGFYADFNEGQYLIDDMYVVDPGDGMGATDYLGNIRVGSQIPVSNGDNIDLTPVGMGTNYQNANNYQVPPANYNFTPTVGEYDLYNMQPNVAAREIYAIQIKGLYYQDDGIQLFAKNQFQIEGQTLTAGSPLGVNQGGYGSINDYWDINPDTDEHFTQYELNHLQAGPLLFGSD